MERMEGDLEGRGEYEGVMAAVVREKERRKRYGCYFLHGCMQLKVE
jgi:hypothetical protein